ncbi:MAG: TonB-dependent siderophore receptor [Marinomonas sp.]
MKNNRTMTFTLQQRHITPTLFCYSILASSMSFAETENEDITFRLSPILVNESLIENTDTESTVAQELWVGGKVATSIQDTPASVSVITEKEITQRDANTTEEVLQYSPGVITEYYATDDRNDYFKIRGFQATTYRDGLTLGSMRGVREEAYAYERIEVIRGANSTLFGPADPGGSVNFVSKQPTFEDFGNVYITYGSNDHKEIGIDTGGTLNNDGTLAYRVTGKLKDSEREYDYSNDDSEFIMAGLTWEPDDYTKATFTLDYLNTDSSPNSGGYPLDKEYDRSDFYGEPDFNYHDVERTNLSAQFLHDFDNGFKVRASLRASELTDNYGYVYLYDSNSTGEDISRYYFGVDSEAEQFIGNIIGQYDITFGSIDSSTLTGVEYLDSSTTSTGYWGYLDTFDVATFSYSGGPTSLSSYQNKKEDYKTKAIFLQQNFALDDKFIATFGIRHDDLDLSEEDYLYNTTSSDEFSEVTTRAALTYKINDQISVYISQVESVEPPSIGTTPERGEQLEIGAKYAPKNINAIFSAAIYDLTQNDISVQVLQDDGSFESELIGQYRAKGIDLEAKAELTDSISLTGGYSYMESEVVEDDNYVGNELSVAPNHTASLWSHYILPRKDMSVGFGVRYIGSYYYDAANTTKSEAATLFDASYSYEISSETNLALNVRNLLDKQYVVGSGSADYYNSGRDITLTLNHSW